MNTATHPSDTGPNKNVTALIIPKEPAVSSQVLKNASPHITEEEVDMFDDFNEGENVNVQKGTF